MIATTDTVFDDLLDYLSPISASLLDPEVSEIRINPDLRVFEEHKGQKRELDVQISSNNLAAVARRIARSNDEEFCEEHNVVKARLQDGSRVTVFGPPATISGIGMVIRKFQRRFFTMDQLLVCGTITEELYRLLKKIVDERANLVVSGATFSGKTTVINALIRLIPADERIVLIEKPAEIQIDHIDVPRLEVNDVNSARDLVQLAMRISPDRIIMGEVLGDEALDMLQSMNSGHTGSFSTIHANSAEDALFKLTDYALMAATQQSNLSYISIRRKIARYIHYVLQLKRMRDGSRVATELIKIHGYNADKDEFLTETLFSVDSNQRGETKQQ